MNEASYGLTEGSALSQTSSDHATIPEHVPAALVRPFDFVDGEGMKSRPHEMMARLLDGPRIIYDPIGKTPDGRLGFWMPTRAQDLREVLLRTDVFSSKGIAGFSALIGESWDLIPVELDPPEHGKYRRLLNPFFSPAAVKALEEPIRAHAIKLVEQVQGTGGCDFVTKFAKPFPILIFMSIMGVPLGRFDDVVAWGHDLQAGTTFAQRAAGARPIAEFLRAEIENVRVAPRDDLISKVVHAELEGRPLTDDEIIGIVYLLFAGGIHSVAATLAFAAQHLARDQKLQARLRANPHEIPAAIEEFTRVYSVVHSFRRVTQDVEIFDVKMKAGDWIKNTLPMANYDPNEFDNPEKVDIDRAANRHMGYSSGAHFCLGINLARFEMAIAWEEWLARIPTFFVDEARTIGTSAPTLLGIDRLMLFWA